jgi:hypothetical protein
MSPIFNTRGLFLSDLFFQKRRGLVTCVRGQEDGPSLSWVDEESGRPARSPGRAHRLVFLKLTLLNP